MVLNQIPYLPDQKRRRGHPVSSLASQDPSLEFVTTEGRSYTFTLGYLRLDDVTQKLPTDTSITH